MKFKLFKEPTFFHLKLCVEGRQRIINNGTVKNNMKEYEK